VKPGSSLSYSEWGSLRIIHGDGTAYTAWTKDEASDDDFGRHTYTEPGSYVIRAELEDGTGQIATDSCTWNWEEDSYVAPTTTAAPTTTTTAPTTTTTSALVAPSAPRNVLADYTYPSENANGLWGVIVSWLPPASSGSSPIDNYVVYLHTHTEQGGYSEGEIFLPGNDTAISITGIDSDLVYAVRVGAFTGGSDSLLTVSDMIWVAAAPVVPATTLAISAGMTYWDCDESYFGDWSCSGNVDKSDYGYEYWDCDESYLGDWSCSGNIDKSDYG